MAPQTIVRQAPLSMGFPRQEYWSGLPFPPPGGLPENPGTEPASLVSPALAGGFFNTSTTWEALELVTIISPNMWIQKNEAGEGKCVQGHTSSEEQSRFTLRGFVYRVHSPWMLHTKNFSYISLFLPFRAQSSGGYAFIL